MNKQKINYYLTLLPFFIFLVLPQTGLGANIKTDLGLYPRPSSLPVFSGSGSVIVDPVFGTSIMKVTDSSDGLECGVNYSYYPSFNKDSTWLMAICNHTVVSWTEPLVIFYKWDPVNFKITQRIARSISDTPYFLDVGQGIWSGTNPNIIYVFKSSTLFSYNVSLNQATIVKDFSTLFPGEYVLQPHRSIDDNVFSFTRKRQSDYGVAGYTVWKKSTDEIIYNENTGHLDEVQVDKTGNYLVVKLGNFVNPEGKIINLTTGAVTELTDGSPDYNLGHSDNGSGIQVGEENWNGRIWKYSLANPSQKIDLIGQSTWGWNNGGGHYSMLADNEEWVLVTTNGGSSVLGGEIYMLATDGSLRIKRLAHHHSNSFDYYDTPRANISRDGKFVAFASNWGATSATNRTDLYVLSTNELVITDTTPPTISNITSSGITATGATITWTTNETGNSQVEYGTTSSYGSTSSLNSTQTLSHSVRVTSLSPGTIYNFRVRSRDAAGNLGVSNNATFTTLSLPTPPPSTPTPPPASTSTSNPTSDPTVTSYSYGPGSPAPTSTPTPTSTTQTPTGTQESTSSQKPTISMITFSKISPTSVSVNWYTDIPSGSSIEYGTNSTYGNTNTTTSGDTTNHSITLTGLVPNTIYYYRLNSGGTYSPQANFTTAPLFSGSQSLSITRNLSRGVTHSEVAVLQNHLKSLGFLSATIGSVPVFGPATEDAVKRYQASRGITPTGTVGLLTRTSLAQENTVSSSALSPTISPSTPPSSISRATVYLGMTHPDVRVLQDTLKRLGYFPVSVESTSYFGPITRQSVQAFQRNYGIVSSGNESTTGYGMAGQRTWGKLLSM